MEQDERSLIEHHFSMLREIFDAIDDMIFVAKSDGCSFRYIWANKAACRTIGMDNVTGKRFEDVLSPERAAKIKENYKQAAQMKTTITYEDEMETSNGWKHYETVLTPLDGEGDRHRWFVAVVRDVTERKMKERELQKMKEQLEASRKRYKTFLEHLPGGVLVFNQEGMVIYANIGAVQLLGVKRKSDIVGIPIWAICQGLNKTVWKRALNGQLSFIEKVDTFDGRTIYVRLSLSYIEYDGNPAIQGIMLDVTERIHYENKLKYLAFHDSLTGFPNRRLFLDLVRQSIEEAKRKNRRLAVMYIDMDRFKEVNDTFGHDVGDQLLKLFAQRVKDNIGANAIPCRIGGDEFLVLVKDVANDAQIEKTAHKLQQSMQPPFLVNGHKIVATISIGIAVYPSDGNSSKELIRHADYALYRAKSVRNSYQFYSQNVRKAAK